MLAEWSFLNKTGHDTGADLLQQYKIYARNSSDAYLEEIGFSGINYGYWLIYDVTANQWHKLITENYYLDVQEISGLGLWEEIFNNVV